MLNHLLDLFVSHTCYCCHRDLTIQEKNVCMSCLSQIEMTHFHLKPSENQLYYRIAGKVPVTRASSLFYFDKGGRLQKLLQALKYHHAPQLGTYLGEIYGKVIKGSDFLSGIDCIVPVPLHPSKRLKRGYNQAELIAKGLSTIVDIPVDSSILKRARFTLTQTQQSRRARWASMENTFYALYYPYKHILLVDDVVTTGSTAEACLRALEANSEECTQVSVAAIAMARRNS